MKNLETKSKRKKTEDEDCRLETYINMRFILSGLLPPVSIPRLVVQYE